MVWNFWAWRRGARREKVEGPCQAPGTRTMVGLEEAGRSMVNLMGDGRWKRGDG